VYHNDPPESLDQYYQEIGRAGRDGAKADAVLFFREEDIGAQAFKAGEGKLDAGLLERVADRFSKAGDPVTLAAAAGELGISRRKIMAALERLRDVGAIEMEAGGEVRIREAVDLKDAALIASREQEARRAAKRERLEEMRAYADAGACRRELLLRYLGDDFTGPCSTCDNCAAGQVASAAGEGTRREVT
jgi:ATP-dependent DNA helicase RecQ